ncbi:MAG TPA: TVP38/TMEM64 family protein [Thermoanaerobaculia bacterium]|nr:TVP38/TMEM64 family protein [Thermoanaerobaculia bacterium]
MPALDPSRQRGIGGLPALVGEPGGAPLRTLLPDEETLMSDATAEPAPRWKILALVAGGLVLLAALFLAGRELGGRIDAFTAWLDGLGVWAPVVFILGYAVATVAFAPGSLLTLAAGALFGLVRGTLYAWTGATLGASAAFLVARYGARGWVERKLEGKPRFQELDRSIGRDGGKIVVLLRLAPVFPFVLLNYALGLTRVRFAHYAWACLAMLPGTLLYVYYGHVGRQALAGGGAGRTVWDWVLLAVGLLAVAAVTVIITRKAKRALAAETGIEPAGVEREPSDV